MAKANVMTLPNGDLYMPGQTEPTETNASVQTSSEGPDPLEAAVAGDPGSFGCPWCGQAHEGATELREHIVDRHGSTIGMDAEEARVAAAKRRLTGTTTS